MGRWASRLNPDVRPGNSSGGLPFAGIQVLPVGLEDDQARYVANANDDLIVRDRTPFLRRPRFIPQGLVWLDWSRQFPTRPQLEMRNATYNPQLGSSATRWRGAHTDTENPRKRTLRRYVETPQMQPGRQNRLLPNGYAGQTLSARTAIQGGTR